jgi:hypothetical protein
LLVKRDSRFEVIETVAPLAAGGEFDKVVNISESERNGMYLLVYKESVAALPVGQTITEVSQQLYWLYGPAK